MRLKLVGDKPDYEFRVGINEDATFANTIPVGTPVVLALNGTDDGIAVVMPSTAGAAQTEALFFGLASRPMPYQQNQKVEVLCNGLASNAVIVRATRSASSASWSSSASLAAWQVLTVDTINNALTIYSTAAGASQYPPFAVLAQSIASMAASATATTDSRTAITISAKAWIQLL